MSEAIVVDTNVAVIANGGQAVSPECELACVRLLREIVDAGGLVVDTGDRIFTEYRRNLQMAGQPGVGDVFMCWVSTNRFNPAACDAVGLTPVGPDETDFAEFPDHAGLADFDPSDKKFVAVANAADSGPPIKVAADRGWARHAEVLSACGIVVDFLCPEADGAR